MEFIGVLGLVLLTMAGYSAGAVLLRRGQTVTPGLIDFALIVILWVLAFSLHDTLGKWMSLLIWLIVGGISGALFTTLRGLSPTEKSNPQALETNHRIGLLLRIREGWKAFAAEMGDFQGRIFMGFFYFLAVTPFGLIVRLFGDPLKLRVGSNQSFWVESSAPDASLEAAKRQF
ncbi:MAG: hypothetical protein HY326_04470 [Chloroflexi bacterium]|nr:hypothetical protein [Chloroflexota bacterium]